MFKLFWLCMKYILYHNPVTCKSIQLKQALAFLPVKNVDISYSVLFCLLKCYSWTTQLILQPSSMLWTTARKTWGWGDKESWASPLPCVLSFQMCTEHLSHNGCSFGQGWVSKEKGWTLGEAPALEQSRRRQESGSGGSSPEEPRPQASKELLEATLGLRSSLLFLRTSTDLQW